MLGAPEFQDFVECMLDRGYEYHNAVVDACNVGIGQRRPRSISWFVKDDVQCHLHDVVAMICIAPPAAVADTLLDLDDDDVVYYPSRWRTMRSLFPAHMPLPAVRRVALPVIQPFLPPGAS